MFFFKIIFTVLYQLHIVAIQHRPVAVVVDVVFDVCAVLFFLSMVMFQRFCKGWCTK